MTLSAGALGLYALAMLALFFTPGPVWVALTARALAGGFAQAAPLAVGVALGDMLWPGLAIFGMAWVLTLYGDLLALMRWVAVAVFVGMGWLLIAHATRPPDPDSRLTRPGGWAGFTAGVAVILANPKAILFYMGVLPGFFDLSQLTVVDIALILALSVGIPLVGNLGMALAIDRARRLLTTPAALARVNRISGAALIAVGLAIAVWG
jgi:threonine/homoserine/homoserine lactone efflux protein